MLMSNDEAMALVHGEMLTLRDGDVTHQAVQTNLADVICGGKKSLPCLTNPSRLFLLLRPVGRDKSRGETVPRGVSRRPGAERDDG